MIEDHDPLSFASWLKNNKDLNKAKIPCRFNAAWDFLGAEVGKTRVETPRIPPSEFSEYKS